MTYDGLSAADYAQQARSVYESEQRAMAGRMHHGYDPRTVTDFENYQGSSHRDLYEKSQLLKGDPVQESAHQWGYTGQALAKTFSDMNTAIQNEIANHWEGSAADAAAGATALHAQRAADLESAFEGVGSKLQVASSGAFQTYSTMPKPVEFDQAEFARTSVQGGVVNPMAGLQDITAQMGRMESARQDAIRVMTGTYQPVYTEADSEVPVIPAPLPPPPGGVTPGAAPPQVVGNGTPPPAVPGGSTSGGDNGPMSTGSGSDRVGGATVQVPGGAAPGSIGGSQVPAATSSAGYAAPTGSGSAGALPGGFGSVGGGSGSGYGGAGGSGYGGAVPGGAYGGAWQADGYGVGGKTAGDGPGHGQGGVRTSAASFGPRGPAGGGSIGAPVALGGAEAGRREPVRGGTSGGTSGGLGAGGTAGSFGSTGESGTGVGGRAGAIGGLAGESGGGSNAGGRAGGGGGGAGSLARGGALGGAVGESAGSAGANTGRGGAGSPMMGGGRGRNGEDDDEHETPSYLITHEHGSQIVGEIPPTAPPVIGA